MFRTRQGGRGSRLLKQVNNLPRKAYDEVARSNREASKTATPWDMDIDDDDDEGEDGDGGMRKTRFTVRGTEVYGSGKEEAAEGDTATTTTSTAGGGGWGTVARMECVQVGVPAVGAKASTTAGRGSNINGKNGRDEGRYATMDLNSDEEDSGREFSQTISASMFMTELFQTKNRTEAMKGAEEESRRRAEARSEEPAWARQVKVQPKVRKKYGSQKTYGYKGEFLSFFLSLFFDSIFRGGLRG